MAALVTAAPAAPASAGAGGAAYPAPDSVTAAAIAASPAVVASPAPLAVAAGPSALAAASPVPLSTTPGFVLRRVSNPRYRPPLRAAPMPGVGTIGALQAMDHARVQIGHVAAGSVTRATEWELEGGEEYRGSRSIEAGIAGVTGGGRTAWRALRLLGRRGPLSGGAGDVPPIALGTLGSLQRLRGATIAGESRSGATWRAAGGVPTPVPGAAPNHLGIGGVTIDRLPADVATVSFSLFGFGRGRAANSGATTADSLAGRGSAGLAIMRAPLALGTLSLGLGGQLHDLDGRRGLAVQQTAGYSFASRALVIALEETRATGRTRELRTEGFAAAPRREDRWNAQARLLRGRAEAHMTGILRDGGEPALSTRSVQIGGSGNIGASGWYSGADFHWRGDVEGAGVERRVSALAGRIGGGGAAFLVRVDRSTRGRGRATTRLMAEAAAPLPHGGRVSLEPRSIWLDGEFEQASLGARIGWPLSRLGARLNAAGNLGMMRDGTHGAPREFTIGISLAPRARDRGELEVRHRDEFGTRSVETNASYELESPRYRRARGILPGREDGVVEVSVVRAGNRSGVPDALVSLDGKELRFTDADGLARFEGVPPGIHVVALEERSLPAAYEPVSAARCFVTVERGRPTEPQRFEIARPERRRRF